MPESIVQLPADSTGKKLRHRERTIGANTVYEQYVIPTSERVVSAEVMCSSWRTIGAAALTQNLFTLENTAGSAVIVALRRLSVQLDATALLAAVAPTVQLSRTTATPTGGTVLAKTLFDTADSSAANVIARAATASHGGAATAITATPSAGTAGWSQLTMRMHSLVGQVLMEDEAVAPSLAEGTPIIIRAGEAVMVQAVAAATSSNPATNHWVLNAMWEEFTLP